MKIVTAHINGNISKQLKSLMLNNPAKYYQLTDGFTIDIKILQKLFATCNNRIVSIQHECETLTQDTIQDIGVIYTNEININYMVIPHSVAEMFVKNDYFTIKEYTQNAYKNRVSLILIKDKHEDKLTYLTKFTINNYKDNCINFKMKEPNLSQALEWLNEKYPSKYYLFNNEEGLTDEQIKAAFNGCQSRIVTKKHNTENIGFCFEDGLKKYQTYQINCNYFIIPKTVFELIKENYANVQELSKVAISKGIDLIYYDYGYTN